MLAGVLSLEPSLTSVSWRFTPKGWTCVHGARRSPGEVPTVRSHSALHVPAHVVSGSFDSSGVLFPLCPVWPLWFVVGFRFLVLVSSLCVGFACDLCVSVERPRSAWTE